jgi:hypothetical protein
MPAIAHRNAALTDDLPIMPTNPAGPADRMRPPGCRGTHRNARDDAPRQAAPAGSDDHAPRRSAMR